MFFCFRGLHPAADCHHAADDVDAEHVIRLDGPVRVLGLVGVVAADAHRTAGVFEQALDEPFAIVGNDVDLAAVDGGVGVVDHQAIPRLDAGRHAVAAGDQRRCLCRIDVQAFGPAAAKGLALAFGIDMPHRRTSAAAD